MLRLAPSWTWDFWLAQEGPTYHLFFLKASRALGDPERRHRRASIGHAVSTDLRTWAEVEDALVASDAPAIDDVATWTGSVIRDRDGLWWMFYTGVDRAGDGQVQRVTAATSADLLVWRKRPDVVLESDSRWYEKLADGDWHDEAFRDPWVFRPDPDGPWQMLITARADSGERLERGVIGHAVSDDLETWELLPPLSTPDAGFGQLEVTQLVEVEGRWVLLFSCLHPELSPRRRAEGQGGIWWLPVDGPIGPFDIAGSRRLTTEAAYSGRLIRDPLGHWVLLAFQHLDDQGRFVGELSDPIRVEWRPDGTLGLLGAPESWVPSPGR